MVVQYSTNVKSQLEAEFLLEILQIKFPDYNINWYLEDGDAILRVASDLHFYVNDIIDSFNTFGFVAEVVRDEPDKRKEPGIYRY
jgi:hypothetical protein